MNSNNDIFKAAFPSPPPSQSLRDSVASAAQVATRRAHRIRLARRIVRSGYAVAAIAAVVALYPSTRAMATGRWLEGKLSSIKSARIDMVLFAEDGTKRNLRKLYFKDSKMRIEDSTSVEIYVGGKTWSFKPNATEALVRDSVGAFAHSPTGFSMKETLGDYERWDWKRRVTVDRGVSTDDGNFDRYTLYAEDRNTREVFYVDPQTDLPHRVELQFHVQDRWVPGVAGTYHLDEYMDPALFKVPARMKVVDAAKASQELVTKLAKTKLSEVKLNSGSFVLRDVTMNKNGQIFVLFTADGKSNPGWMPMCLRVTDALGTTYVQVSDFHVASEMDGNPQGLWIGRLPIHTVSLVPLEPTNPVIPRQVEIQLIMHEGSLASAEPWYSVAPDGKKTLMQPDMSQYDLRTVFKSTLSPIPSDFPAYTERTPMALMQCEISEVSAEVSRSRYYQLLEDWAGVARHTEKRLQVIDLAEAKGLGPFARYDAYWDLYRANKELGKHDVARQYLIKTRDSAREFYNQGFEKDLEKALKEEGIR